MLLAIVSAMESQQAVCCRNFNIDSCSNESQTSADRVQYGNNGKCASVSLIASNNLLSWTVHGSMGPTGFVPGWKCLGKWLDFIWCYHRWYKLQYYYYNQTQIQLTVFIESPPLAASAGMCHTHTHTSMRILQCIEIQYWHNFRRAPLLGCKFHGKLFFPSLQIIGITRAIKNKFQSIGELKLSLSLSPLRYPLTIRFIARNVFCLTKSLLKAFSISSAPFGWILDTFSCASI